MSLFRNLNKQATKDKASRILSHYRALRRIAGESFSPKVTASYSFEPRSQTNLTSNAIEKHVVRQVAAEQKLLYIEQAINAIIDVHVREVLIRKYCDRKEKSDIQIYMDLGYSESEYYRIWERGIFEFAEVYLHGELLVFEEGVFDEILGDFC